MSVSIHFQSDFKKFETAKAPFSFQDPFRFVYYTSGATTYEASYLDGEYKNCVLMGDGSLKVIFEDHGLAPGRLMCRKEYYLADSDFADGERKQVVLTPTDTFLLAADDVDVSVEMDTEITDVVEGSYLVMTFKMSPVEGIALSDCEFTLEYYTNSITKSCKKVKSDGRKISDDEYEIIVDTKMTGHGLLKCLATINLPREGYDEPLPIIKDLTTNITINKKPK